jgi:hypothetical protein
MKCGLRVAFADTLEPYQPGFFPGVVISLGYNSGTPLYLNPHTCVNTILFFGRGTIWNRQDATGRKRYAEDWPYRTGARPRLW